MKNVSASFSRQILKGAISAIFVSFALIALYVTFRYRWRFAVPILRTLINDIPIMLGVYAISGREVSAATVAACSPSSATRSTTRSSSSTACARTCA